MGGRTGRLRPIFRPTVADGGNHIPAISTRENLLDIRAVLRSQSEVENFRVVGKVLCNSEPRAWMGSVRYVSLQFQKTSIIACAPISTPPTNGWSRTQRVAMLAMLIPPCRSPIVRKTLRSDWNCSHVPQDIKITSRY